MRTLSLVAAALLAAACASHDNKAPESTAANDASRGTGSASTAGTASPRDSGSVNGNATADAGPPKGSVYFDFDSNSVRDEYRPLIQAHSSYLSRDKRDARIRIEGNCDERGSREYNLALGQRRAEAVKKIMTVLGAPDARIETISYGEEKPVAMGHDESSWAKNRRADIKYAGE